MITIDDMRAQVTMLLAESDCLEDFDVDGIVDEIHGQRGLVDMDDVPDFWEIVSRHDKS